MEFSSLSQIHYFVLDMPFWARIDSGKHQTDSTLSVHISSQGKRKRHDSVLSRTSLGDENEAVVTLDGVNEFRTLNEVLQTLPGSL